MKEQGRQYQATVFTHKNGSATQQFKSKKKAEQWAKEYKGMTTYKVEPVK